MTIHPRPWPRWPQYLMALPMLLWGCSVNVAKAQIAGQSVVYTVDNRPYEGYFARNAGFGEHQPLVFLIHDWNGLDNYEKRRAEMLAEQGYATFAVDLYGQGVRPQNVEQSRQESGKLYQNRPLMLHRLVMGLDRARQLPGIDPQRIVAIGYCFGGSAVLELARSGANVQGFVSFHGGLDTPPNENYTQVKAPILILHGTADPFAPLTQVSTLGQALTDAGVPFQMELYGGVKHAFTVWGAKMDGVQYDATADRASWRSLFTFLQERLD